MKLHVVLGTCAITVLILLWAGAPLPSILAGVCSATYLTWRKYRREQRKARRSEFQRLAANSPKGGNGEWPVSRFPIWN